MLHPVKKPPTYPVDADFLKWIAQQPCAACGEQYPTGFDRIEAAHLDSRRYGDGRNAIPLCGCKHHREGKASLHQMGRKKFAARWHLNLREVATMLWERYQAEQIGDLYMRAFE